ncbi:MAG: sulfatase-like hydrolase/transferase [Lentisphaerae bacterium]|nr:sulfatase-like hydrolase/transferase [Lentisphaerota bacterium]
MTRPNILFILSDQHNAKVMGCKGHPDVQTPSLDRMATEGVRFDNTIAQNPICTPSRVSWLSGQYCLNHGYYGLKGPNPRGLPTVLGHFRSSGYRTAAIGKIHCPANWVEDDSDLFLETGNTSIGGRSAEYADYLDKRNLTELEDHGSLNEFGERGRQAVDGRPSMVSYADGQEGWAARKAREFMGACAKDKVPFFVHVSLPKPHQCYTPAKEFWDLYPEERLTLPPNADYEMAGKAPHLKKQAEMWRNRPWQLFEPKTFEAGRLRKLRGYLGNVSHVDHAVGELLDWLDANGLGNDTIVVYSSDHGDYACEHGIMEKAPGICSDAITRIPMIWRWPGQFKSGHVVEEIVESVDMANTLCALAGLEAMETADGQDISPLLQGSQREVRTIGVTECTWSKSVRKGKHRLVYYPRQMFADEYPEGFGELYNLEADPWEMHNLFFTPDYAGVKNEMQQALTDWLITARRPKTTQPAIKRVTPQRSLDYSHAVNADGKINPDLIKQLGKKNYT